jgi:ABC-2 type transport system ATP-binding protein
MALQGTVTELAHKVLGGAYRIQIEAEGPVRVLKEALQKLPQTIQVRHMDGSRFEVESRSDVRADAAEALMKGGGKLLMLNVEYKSLDDIYARYFEEAKYAARA